MIIINIPGRLIACHDQLRKRLILQNKTKTTIINTVPDQNIFFGSSTAGGYNNLDTGLCKNVRLQTSDSPKCGPWRTAGGLREVIYNLRECGCSLKEEERQNCW